VATERLECALGAPLIPFTELAVHRLSGGGYTPRKFNEALLTAPLLDAVAASVSVPPLAIEIQAIELSPYRTGLAGQHLQRLPVFPASPTCSFPLRLSPSGQSDGPEVLPPNFF
jgi:hypothetical protein